jgi:hypothetical protein
MKKHRESYVDIDMDLLKKLYIEENKTLDYLSKNVFFVARQTLMNRLKEHNLYRKVPVGRRAGYINVDVELLKELYYNQRNSLHEISRKTGFSYHLIIKRMEQFNLPRRHRAEHMKKGYYNEKIR